MARKKTGFVWEGSIDHNNIISIKNLWLNYIEGCKQYCFPTVDERRNYSLLLDMATHKQENGLESYTSLTDMLEVTEKLFAILKSAKYKGITIK